MSSLLRRKPRVFKVNLTLLRLAGRLLCLTLAATFLVPASLNRYCELNAEMNGIYVDIFHRIV